VENTLTITNVNSVKNATDSVKCPATRLFKQWFTLQFKLKHSVNPLYKCTWLKSQLWWPLVELHLLLSVPLVLTITYRPQWHKQNALLHKRRFKLQLPPTHPKLTTFNKRRKINSIINKPRQWPALWKGLLNSFTNMTWMKMVPFTSLVLSAKSAFGRILTLSPKFNPSLQLLVQAKCTILLVVQRQTAARIMSLSPTLALIWVRTDRSCLRVIRCATGTQLHTCFWIGTLRPVMTWSTGHCLIVVFSSQVTPNGTTNSKMTEETFAIRELPLLGASIRICTENLASWASGISGWSR